MNRWVALCLGSVTGGLSRYLLAGFIYSFAGTNFPYGTFVVNITGCFLIGIFHALAEVKMVLSPEARLLMMTGFCGAYTTFSALILETSNLLKRGQTVPALTNVLVSLLVGF